MVVHLASQLAERDSEKPVRTKSLTRHVWASEEAEGGRKRDRGKEEGRKEERDRHEGRMKRKRRAETDREEKKKGGLVRRGGGEGGEKDGRWKDGKVDVRNSCMKKRTIKGSVTERERNG